MSNELKCDVCGELVRLERTKHKALNVACACEGRRIKVAQATPEGWA